MSPRVLFVDDEAPIRELLALFFRKKSFAVSTAVNGDEARALLRGDRRIDLVVVDLDLAGENGLELLKELKARAPELPFVILTGMGADDRLVKAARKAGACSFYSKTESLHTLYKGICRILGSVEADAAWDAPASRSRKHGTRIGVLL